MGWSWWSTYFEILLVGEFIELTTGLPGGGLRFLCIFGSRFLIRETLNYICGGGGGDGKGINTNILET